MTTRAWPSDWNERVAGRGSPICSALGGGESDYWVHVATGEVAEVRLERTSPVPGYCLVVWRHGHVAEPTELDAAQAISYFSELLAVGAAVTAHFAPTCSSATPCRTCTPT